MKKLTNHILLAGIIIVLSGCTATDQTNQDKLQNGKDYSQYNNMLQVLQSVQGLRVMGTGSDARVFMSGYNSVNATQKEPLYVVDGVPVTSSLSQLNLLITPVQVKKVRTIRGTQATSRYGDQGLFGVVLITTIASEK